MCKNDNRQGVYLITREFFYTLTMALVCFFIMELIWPRIVLSYININIVLIFWVINASVMFIVNDKF